MNTNAEREKAARHTVERAASRNKDELIAEITALLSLAYSYGFGAGQRSEGDSWREANERADFLG